MKANIVIFSTVLLLSCATALAGPVRPIRSNNFQNQTPCGPPWDAMAQQGQWFEDPANGETHASTWEFHDDDNSLSIEGVVQNIQYQNPANSNSNIMAFDVLVTVINNLPSELQAGSSSNSHNEVQLPVNIIYEEGTLFEPRITAEFAIADPMLVPNGTLPYWGDPVSPTTGSMYHIEAVNEDERGWYCWNDPAMPGGLGNFQVPTWRLQPSIIPPGQIGTATMSFIVTGTGMSPIDYRHSVIRHSHWHGADLLYNRHNSLKISHWLDTLLIDDGYNNNIIYAPPGEYEIEPPEYVYASDASVFFNTTPPGEMAELQITPVTTNQSPDAVILSWDALDAIDYHIQYADKLTTNTTWTLIPGSGGIPGMIPSPMTWVDDGTIITNLPVQQQPQRFYRLVEP